MLSRKVGAEEESDFARRFSFLFFVSLLVLSFRRMFAYKRSTLKLMLHITLF